jgi:hypothetical protein
MLTGPKEEEEEEVPKLVALEESEVHPLQRDQYGVKRTGPTFNVQIISQTRLKFCVWMCKCLHLQLQSRE